MTGCIYTGANLPKLGKIAGTVVDQAGASIPQAKASIHRLDIATVSDENGCFIIENVPSGPRILMVSSPGHRNWARYVLVRAGQESTVTCTMRTDTPDPGEPWGGYPYAASKNSDVFHRRSCRYTRTIKLTNLLLFETREAAIRSGYRPCKVCRP